MNKEKEVSNVVIYLCMVLLATFIAFPPLLRAFSPEEAVAEEKKQKIVLLTCNIQKDDYQIQAKTKYLNKKPQTVTLKYSMLTKQDDSQSNAVSEDSVTVPETNQENLIPDLDLEWLRELTDAKITEDENNFSIVLTEKTLMNNSNFEMLPNYFASQSEQEQYYQSLGYSCVTVES